MITPHQFHYDLPESFIAQTPANPRDAAKLMVINRSLDTISHRIFSDLLDILTANDVLVLNDSKVFTARLVGQKQSGGRAEVLLLRPIGNDTWTAMSNGLKPPQIVEFDEGLTGEVVSKNEATGDITIKLLLTSEVAYRGNLRGCISETIERVGKTPLPHYIHTPLSEEQIRSEYQTVYANEAGSTAAPTAGMHFTEELLRKIKEKGTQIERVTLHVGPGTFAKLRPEQIESQTLHEEWYEIKPEVVDRLNEAKRSGKRIIAVGTTSCRTLESACECRVTPCTTQEQGVTLHSGIASTSIFIMPGYTFKFVDALITNFHLPESSLLMLVTAFVGAETFHESLIEKAYEAAKSNNYRFFSFGDAMLIE